MEFIELGYTLKPILLEDELLMTIVGKATLAAVSDERRPGTIYLTSHRIIFVDDSQPELESRQLWLYNVADQETVVNFLRTSSKIIIRVATNKDLSSIETPVAARKIPFSSFTPKSHKRDTSVSSSLRKASIQDSDFKPISDWKCSICSHFNINNSDNKCQLCGVVKLNSPIKASEDENTKLSCPTCTFLNHPALSFCELCGASLKKSPEEKPDSSKNQPNRMLEKNSSASPQPHPQYQCIVLRFEKNNATSFGQILKRQLVDKIWQRPEPMKSIVTESPNVQQKDNIGGISAIMTKSQESEKARKQLLDDAFEDLDELSLKAKEIVLLAKDIVSRLNANNTPASRGSSDLDSTPESEFTKYLSTIGIDNPVTKDIAGSSYHKALARELFEFLEDYIFKNNGIVLLTDAYCLYNRARSFSSVFPADFIEACKLFNDLGLPLRLRKFPSGLLALQSDSSIGITSSSGIYSDPNSKVNDIFAERVKELIASFGYLSAIQYSAIDGLPLMLANELLLFYEQQLILCRDETLNEIRFYENLLI